MPKQRIEILFELPPYCFAQYAFETDARARLDLPMAHRSAVFDAVCAKSVGYCDGAEVDAREAASWAVMYEDLEGFKCWSYLPKTAISIVSQKRGELQ